MGRRPATPARLLVAVTGFALLVVVGQACLSSNEEPTVEAFCEKLAQAYGAEGAMASLDAGEPASRQAVVEEFRDLQRVAPEEIRPAAEVVADVVAEVIAVLESSDDREALRSLSAEFEAYQPAADELAAYASTHCDMNLNAGLVSTPVP